MFVAGGFDGIARVEWKLQALGDRRGYPCRAVADCNDAVEGVPIELGKRFERPVESNGQRAVPPRIVQDMAAVGREN
jgi:hypothetical protein